MTISYTDNDVLRVLSSTIDTALVQGGYLLADGTSYPVVQKDQPTQQGIPSVPTVYFQKLFDDIYGFPLSRLSFNKDKDAFDDSETQLYETHVQISALVIQDPTKPDMPTASDVVNYLKLYVASVRQARIFQKQGIGLLRVTHTPNEAFEDDRHRFEYHPSFDLVFTYARVITFETPKIERIIPATVDGFGQSPFPV